MKITDNFSASEVVVSGAHPSLSIPFSEMSPQAAANATRLICRFLQPLRDVLGPIRVLSFYRTQALNDAVGGAPDSKHLWGLAADFYAVEYGPETVFGRLHGMRDSIRHQNIRWDRCNWYPKKGSLHVDIRRPEEGPDRLLLYRDWVKEP